MFKEENQIYLLAVTFVTIVMVPIVLLIKTKDTNDPSQLYFSNGIFRGSAVMMMANLFESLEKNMRKKVKKFTHDQFIEAIEMSREMQQANADLGKKTIIRDLIRNRILGLPISEKFADSEAEIIDKIPKLAHVIAQSFTDVKFLK